MTEYPAPPPTEVRNIKVLTEGIWLWNWIPPVFPTSVKVRPADMDGWVEQSGQILLLDGCIGRGDKPSQAVRRAVHQAGNITYLALSTDDAGWDAEHHVPRYITHYALLPAPGWNPSQFQWNGRWTPWPTSGESLWRTVALIAQWAAWAVHKTDPA